MATVKEGVIAIVSPFIAALRQLNTVVDHKCIIQGETTGAPNEIQNTNLGNSTGIVSTNTRYVLSNPFGENTPVIAIAEILMSGEWSYAGVHTSANSAWLVECTYRQGTGLIVQTGRNGVLPALSSIGGDGFGRSGASITTARCRVHVWRVRN